MAVDHLSVAILYYFISNNNLSGCVKLGGPALVNQVEISSGTPYIDFHFDNSEDDFTSRIIESTRGNLDFQCSDVRRNGSSPVVTLFT